MRKGEQTGEEGSLLRLDKENGLRDHVSCDGKACLVNAVASPGLSVSRASKGPN